MTDKKNWALRGALLALGMGALGACTGPEAPPPVPDAPRRATMGGPAPVAGAPAAVQTDPAGMTTRREGTGAMLAPGSAGPVGAGGPDTSFSRSRQGAPLP